MNTTSARHAAASARGSRSSSRRSSWSASWPSRSSAAPCISSRATSGPRPPNRTPRPGNSTQARQRFAGQQPLIEIRGRDEPSSTARGFRRPCPRPSSIRCASSSTTLTPASWYTSRFRSGCCGWHRRRTSPSSTTASISIRIGCTSRSTISNAAVPGSSSTRPIAGILRCAWADGRVGEGGQVARKPQGGRAVVESARVRAVAIPSNALRFGERREEERRPRPCGPEILQDVHGNRERGTPELGAQLISLE